MYYLILTITLWDRYYFTDDETRCKLAKQCAKWYIKREAEWSFRFPGSGSKAFPFLSYHTAASDMYKLA